MNAFLVKSRYTIFNFSFLNTDLKMAQIVTSSDLNLHLIASILKEGGVAIVPTDTVYGLVCHPDFPQALERIRQMKHRDRDKPFQLLMASVDQVWENGAVKTPEVEQFASFWPGGLTLVLETHDGRTEGYRVPNDAQLQKLLLQSGGALKATSVNVSGEPPAISLETIPTAILEAVDIILDGGEIPIAEASTVLKISQQAGVQVLRSGQLSRHLQLS
jgi:tRNA threonylcarbamoyl adenosine modification protein (Sua5/YciO/YrdC/YwlC family)